MTMVLDTTIKTYPPSILDNPDTLHEWDGQYSFLSPEAPSPIVVYGFTFPTVAHAFAAARIDPYRGVHPRDQAFDLLERIANAPTPAQARALVAPDHLEGRPLVRPDWKAIQVERMHTLLVRSYATPPRRTALLETKARLLIAAGPRHGGFWGVEATDQGWVGRNILAMLLMKIRADTLAWQAAQPAD